MLISAVWAIRPSSWGDQPAAQRSGSAPKVTATMIGRPAHTPKTTIRLIPCRT